VCAPARRGELHCLAGESARHLADNVHRTRPEKEPAKSEPAEEAREFFARLKPEAVERMGRFLDALEQHLAEHPARGTVESFIQETLDSINELPRDERQRIQKFLDVLDDRFRSPSALNS